jgi:ferredoxin
MARPDAWASSATSTTSGGRTGTAAARRPNGWTLDVDRIRCDGYGMCAELLPELIALDDWGYPIVRPGGVPEDLAGLARRAVDVCPVLALALRRVLPRS